MKSKKIEVDVFTCDFCNRDFKGVDAEKKCQEHEKKCFCQFTKQPLKNGVVIRALGRRPLRIVSSELSDDGDYVYACAGVIDCNNDSIVALVLEDDVVEVVDKESMYQALESAKQFCHDNNCDFSTSIDFSFPLLSVAVTKYFHIQTLSDDLINHFREEKK